MKTIVLMVISFIVGILFFIMSEKNGNMVWGKMLRIAGFVCITVPHHCFDISHA